MQHDTNIIMWYVLRQCNTNCILNIQVDFVKCQEIDLIIISISISTKYKLHGGVGSIVDSQFQVPWYNPELRLSLCGVSHTFLIFIWVSSGFLGFLPPAKNNSA